MTALPKAAAARDIEFYFHPVTNARWHEQVGPIIIANGKGIHVYDDAGREYFKAGAPAVKLPADSVPVKIGLGDELELIGYRIDALPTVSEALQLTLWWRGVRSATEDWTAFFHLTPSANNAELVGQLDRAITDHEYPPTVWAAGEVVQEQVQISAAKLQAGSYAVWMGMYAPVTQMRAAVEAAGVVVDNRALLLEFQLGP